MADFESEQTERLPEWAQNIRMSYQALRNAENATLQDLGNFETIGRYEQIVLEKRRSRFYDFLHSLTNPPAFVLLRRGSRATMEIRTSAGSMVHHADPFTEYYVPAQHKIYGINLQWNPEQKYFPESPDFVGFAEAVQEGEGTLVPIGRDSLPTEMSAHQKEHGRVREFSKEEMGLIIQAAKHATTTEEQRQLCQGVQKDMEQFDAEEQTEKERLEQQHIGSIKTRVANLIRSIEENAHKRVLDRVDAGNELFLLTTELKLITVPQRGLTYSWMGTPSLDHDFEHAQDASPLKWLRAYNIADSLLEVLRKDIREKIKKSVT